MVNSIFKTYEVTVDTMKDSSVPQNMRYSQNDLKSAKILINVNHDGNEEDFSEAIAVRVSFEKSDKKIVYQDCQPINVMKGKYQVLLTTQTLTSVGIVTAHIHIYFPNDKKVETGSFTFEVVESKMSDEVIESTDSFTVIQKAIEAGQKLEGKDIDGIIAAGAKADAALPKTGGTMTGPIVMTSGDFEFKNVANGVVFRNNQTGIFSFYDKAQDQVIWTYNPATKEFNVTTQTNLVKKGGDIMTGNLKLDRAKGLYRWVQWTTDSAIAFSLGITSSETFMLQDTVNNQTIFSYNPTTKELIFPSGQKLTVNTETNLVKKAGDTMTGNLVMSNDRGVFYQNKAGASILAHKIDVTDVFSLRDVINGRNVYTVTGNDFIVNYNLKTAKDGQVDMVVTADGTAFDPGTPSIARRRGNTVTLRIALRRNVGSTDSIVATIPADMRPSTFMVTNALATDGTVVRLTVEAAGNIKFSATDKSVYATITYVVD